MAGIPLKSGADFYVLEAARMRLHNLGADPTEYGDGLIYFNNSDGNNTSRRARIYDGTTFRSLAFLDEIANNEAFNALQEKVALLAGDVDTDEIISNMKEVSAFLEGFAEDASLMDLLNDKLSLSQGGRMGASKRIEWGSEGTDSFIIGDNNGLYISASKLQRRTADAQYYDILDSRGGTISNTSDIPLVINAVASSSRIQFRTNSENKALMGYDATVGTYMYNYASRKFIGILDDGTPYFNDGTKYNTILTSAGGTIESENYDAFKIKRTTDAGAYITFENKNGRLGSIGFEQSTNKPILYRGATTSQIDYILHSGNYSDYALPLSGGTLSGTSADILTINRRDSDAPTTIVYNKNGNLLGRIGFDTSGNPVAQVGGTYYNILTSAGGTIDGSKAELLNINSTDTWVGMNFSVNGSRKAQMGWGTSDGAFIYNFTSSKLIGVKDDGTPHYSGNTLLHSGNVGDYALKTDGSNAMNADVGIKWTNGSLNADNVGNYFVVGTDTTVDSTLATHFGQYATFLNVAGNVSAYRFQLASKANSASNSLVFRSYTTSGWNPWKTIAFTDSNVASAQALITADNKYLVQYNGVNTLYIGNGIYDTSEVNILGSRVVLRYGTSATNGLILNYSGNVTIGGSDLAGTGTKLHVEGLAYTYSLAATRSVSLNRNPNNGTIYDSATLALAIESSGDAITFGAYRGDSSKIGTPLALSKSGNVLIGTSEDDTSGAKLQVAGHLRMDGNIHIGQESTAYTTQRYLYFWKGDGTYRHRGLMGVNESGAFWNYYNPLAGTYRGLNIGPEGLTYSKGLDTPALVINAAGNVGIGTNDPKYKLDVVGEGRFSGELFVPYLELGLNMEGIYLSHNGIAWHNENYTWISNLAKFTNNNVQLHQDTEIIGNLHVTGNIIADGEVSAGGAGEEGETEGTGNASAWAQTFTPTNTTMPFEHNRATTDVIVQVYEKNDGGSWDMILVDVEIISETKVNLHFGRTENREHKIVIMG